MSHEIRTEPTAEKDWLGKVIKSVREEVAEWPDQKNHKSTPEVREQIKQEALDDFSRREGHAGTQKIVGEWVVRSFGRESFENLQERAKRVLEEVAELAQAGGVPLEEAEHLLRYVYSRPVGELRQELAGTLMTLNALAESAGISMDEVFSEELSRVLSLPVEHFQKRRAVKVEAGVAI